MDTNHENCGCNRVESHDGCQMQQLEVLVTMKGLAIFDFEDVSYSIPNDGWVEGTGADIINGQLHTHRLVEDDLIYVHNHQGQVRVTDAPEIDRGYHLATKL